MGDVWGILVSVFVADVAGLAEVLNAVKKIVTPPSNSLLCLVIDIVVSEQGQRSCWWRKVIAGGGHSV